jgi:hypothetical protein
MSAGKDVVIQITTQQRNPDGSYAIAEALTTVENSIIIEHVNDEGIVTARSIECRYPKDSGLTFRKVKYPYGSSEN